MFSGVKIHFRYFIPPYKDNFICIFFEQKKLKRINLEKRECCKFKKLLSSILSSAK